MKKTQSASIWDVVVIGAGLAGLSTAYHLAKNTQFKRILILERELGIGTHASGKNAGMIRQTVEDPYLMELAVEGRGMLADYQKKSLIRSDFASNGSILLGGSKEKENLEAIHHLLLRKKIKSEFLSKKETAQKVSVLQDGAFENALYCSTDGLVDLNTLLEYFLKAVQKAKVELRFGESIEAIDVLRNSFRVRLKGSSIETEKIMNAAGAWAGPLGGEAGATNIPFKAYRRHLFVTEPSKEFSSKWPFVWHLGNEFYFRPIEGGRLLMSPCDKELFLLDDLTLKSDLTKLENEKRNELKQKLESFSKRFKTIKIEGGRSALRTMVPDGRFVIGEDPALQNFYWVAGLGGHGVTTSFAVGAFAADCAAGKALRPDLAQALSPVRFSR